jgi:toxin CcdB
MPQFQVHRNSNAATRERFPYLLDVQSDLLSGLATRVVAPLCPAAALEGGSVETLTPLFDIAGARYAMLTPQLAGVPSRQLGAEVASLAEHRGAIIAALDLLFTGF